jgi:integrase
VLLPSATKVIDQHIKKYDKLGVDLMDRFWPQHLSFENGFDNLLNRCGMKQDPVSKQSYSIYSLRHTYITHRLLAGVTSDLIASQCGTSVKMIELHYSNVVPLLAKNKVVQMDEDSVEYKSLDTNYNQLFEEV